MFKYTIIAYLFTLASLQVVDPLTTCKTHDYQVYFNMKIATQLNKTNAFCQQYYNNFGSCANITAVNTTANNVTSILNFQSVSQFQYAYLLRNMTILQLALNGKINGDITTTNTLKNSLQAAWDSKINYYTYVPSWVADIQTNALSSINTCFANWANVTIGMLCAISSNKELAFDVIDPATTSTTKYGLKTKNQNVVNALMKCFPLFDLFCTMSYGISITNSQLPFNKTINFPINQIPKSVCESLRTIADKVDDASNAIRTKTMLSFFNTNGLPFAPDFDVLNSLAVYMIAVKDPSTYTLGNSNGSVSPNSAGLVVTADSPDEDFYNAGVTSSVNGVIYGIAFKRVHLHMIFSWVLSVFLFKF